MLKTPDEDIPWENICSIGIRIRYGRFDFFTGGDMYGIPDPGMPAWVDIESLVRLCHITGFPMESVSDRN